MDVFKIAVKLFVEKDEFAHEEFVPIFHRWIQNQSLEGHLLIDVADYSHVDSGPGTVLVASEANIHMDRGENRLGLMYIRKAPMPGTFADRLAAVLAITLKLAAALEREPSLAGKLKFRTDEILFRFNDRLLAANNDANRRTIEAEIQVLAKRLFDKSSVSLQTNSNPLELIETRLKISPAISLDSILRHIKPA